VFEQVFGELSSKHILVSSLIFGAFLGLAWLFRVFLARAAKKLAQRTGTGLDDTIVSAPKRPIVAIIVLEVV